MKNEQGLNRGNSQENRFRISKKKKDALLTVAAVTAGVGALAAAIKYAPEYNNQTVDGMCGGSKRPSCERTVEQCIGLISQEGVLEGYSCTIEYRPRPVVVHPLR